MKPVILAIVAGLCWGIGEVCTRSALHSGKFGPISAITIRSLVALPLLLAVYWLMTKGGAGLRPEPSPWAADGGNWTKVLIGSGVVAGGIAMASFYMALSVGEVSVVKPIAFSVAPAVGVLLGWLVLGESMDMRKGVAVGLIVLGVVVLSTGSRAAPAGGHSAEVDGPAAGGTR